MGMRVITPSDQATAKIKCLATWVKETRVKNVHIGQRSCCLHIDCADMPGR